MPRTTESPFNFALGEVLRTKHPRWREPDRIVAEATGTVQGEPGLRPDIVVLSENGLPVVVETEFAPAHTVEQDAVQRLAKRLQRTGEKIEQALAVRVPQGLATASQHELDRRIREAGFEFCVFSGEPHAPKRWPETSWIEGTIDDLANAIEQASLSEDRVAEGIKTLEDGIAHAAHVVRHAYENAPSPTALEEIAEKLHQEDSEQTSRMAMAIVANAMTFHTAIAGAHGIDTLDQMKDANGKLLKGHVLAVWRHILRNINYWPIFHIASQILLPIRNGVAQRILDHLAEVAVRLDQLGATSQHDLCGRMFQRLISDRKFLATFYTLPTSAALLAELAVSRLEVDWSDAEAVTRLRLGDFACGTGALLNAAYGAAAGRMRRAGLDDRELHGAMMERALVGTDIMPAATHLTATVLSSNHPNTPFEDTSIATLHYGIDEDRIGRTVALGALDLIEREIAPSLFETKQARLKGTEGQQEQEVQISHDSFDLVTMNPPFTRPTNHESAEVPVPSFAGFSTSDDEQKAMSSRLKKIQAGDMAGHGNAGLASNFIDIAHAKLREGGVLGLVVPAAFTQGGSWEPARALLERHYRDIMVVSIAATGATERAFSADTGMAEVLVVATKDRVEKAENPTTFINIERRPRSILEAALLAKSIHLESREDKAASLHITREDRFGCSIQGSLQEAGAAGVRAVEVAEAAESLTKGNLVLPRMNEPVRLPLCELGELGTRGVVDRDINGTEKLKQGGQRGPFDIEPIRTGTVPTWPALWSHDAKRESKLNVEPDKQGIVRAGIKKRATALWNYTASKLHFNRDFRLNSQPLAACLTPTESLGGSAWPNFRPHDKQHENAIALWANSTLGIINSWWKGTRQQQGRARLTISRLPELTALDSRKLTSEQLQKIDEIFEQFEHRDFLPANEAYRDQTRQALDRALLIDLLGLQESVLEELALLRLQWCSEPSVHGGKSTKPDR